MKPLSTQRSGLTLIELLVTITIIMIIAGAVVMRIDIKGRLESGRNTRRLSDVAIILDALKAFQSSHDGNLRTLSTDTPASFDLVDTNATTYQIIGSAPVTPAVCATYTCPGAAPMAAHATSCFTNWFTAPNATTNTSINPLKSYLAKVPADPLQKGQVGRNDTRYFVNYDATTGNVTVGSCDGNSPDAAAGVTEPILLVQ